jgi:hypothetical protein
VPSCSTDSVCGVVSFEAVCTFETGCAVGCCYNVSERCIRGHCTSGERSEFPLFVIAIASSVLLVLLCVGALVYRQRIRNQQLDRGHQFLSAIERLEASKKCAGGSSQQKCAGSVTSGPEQSMLAGATAGATSVDNPAPGSIGRLANVELSANV